MQKIRFAFLLILSLAGIQSPAQNMLHYLIRQPSVKSEHPPILLLLHGVGSNEEDLFALAAELPPQFLVISARAPITLGPSSYGWYHVQFSGGKPVYDTAEEQAARDHILQLIAGVKTRYGLTQSKVYLCGFSQGAIMSYSIALLHQNAIAGAALMSGRLLEAIRPQVQLNNKATPPSLFIAHGIQDQTLGIQYAREARAYLQSLGLNPEYHEYPAGHTISNEMLKDLIRWLASKH